jgi:hypothetical protein
MSKPSVHTLGSSVTRCIPSRKQPAAAARSWLSLPRWNRTGHADDALPRDFPGLLHAESEGRNGADLSALPATRETARGYALNDRRRRARDAVPQPRRDVGHAFAE